MKNFVSISKMLGGKILDEKLCTKNCWKKMLSNLKNVGPSSSFPPDDSLKMLSTFQKC
jgi:hypothetical protein